MSRRRRQGLSPSLFPFLAVLVCTLGTLILLLALVAQNATVAAEQSARAQQAKNESVKKRSEAPSRITRASAEELLKEEQFRVQQLVAVRDQQTADIEQRRDELAHVDDHIVRLRSKLKRLSEEIQQATGETETPAVSTADISAIQNEIETERLAIEKLKEESEDQTPRVVIVPHKGPNGTDRRPVYLECTEEGVTIWPEGSKITAQQLEDSSYSANPLDAALRTVRMHAMKTYGDPAPPYPLLVVRPNGIETYALARRAMREWDDQFGYELVPGEVKLAFSKPDPNLKRRMDLAINTAVSEQRVRLAMSQRAGRGGRSGSSGAYTGGRGQRGSLPTLSAADLDRAGRANGFRQHRDNLSTYSQNQQFNRGSYNNPRRQIGSVQSNNYAGGRQLNDAGAAARRMAAQMESAAQEIRSAQNGAASGSLSPPSTGSGQPVSPLGNHYADLESADAIANSLGEPNPQNLGETPNSAERSYAGQEVTSRSPGSTLLMPGAGNDKETSDRGGDQLQTEPLANQNRRSGGKASQRPNSPDPDGQPIESGNDSAAEGTSTAAPTSILDSTASAQINSPMNQSSSSMSGNPAAMSGQQSSDGQPPPDAPPDMQAPMSPMIDLVKREGRDWAIPRSMAGMRGNQIIRNMRVECHSDRFVLLPAKNEGPTEVFGIFNGDVDRATMELATALRDRIEQWGPALPGGRWQPRLEAQIKPNGAMRFHQLRTLMNGSGIEVVGRESP